jgi:hypothetical protein
MSDDRDDKYLLKPVIPQPQSTRGSGASNTRIRLEYLFVGFIMVAVVLTIGWMQQRDEAAAASDRQPDTVISTKSAAHIITALHRCPPADATTTHVLVIIVDAPPSGPIRVADCLRIAKRPYQVR